VSLSGLIMDSAALLETKGFQNPFTAQATKLKDNACPCTTIARGTARLARVSDHQVLQRSGNARTTPRIMGSMRRHLNACFAKVTVMMNAASSRTARGHLAKEKCSPTTTTMIAML
jgi:hypothetical protein